MRRALRWLTVAVGAIALAIAGVAVLARFSDGPIGPFPGGALSGEWVAEPVASWEGVLETGTRVALQVGGARSVTVSTIVHDGRLYVPSLGAERKRWPADAMRDGRVVLRHAGRLHRLQAVRVTSPEELRPLVRTIDADPGDDLSELSTWYFRLDPPTGTAGTFVK